MNTQSFVELTQAKNTEAATAYLICGWELVDTYTRLLGEAGEEKIGDEYMVFVLGWPRHSGVPQTPKVPHKDNVDL